MKRVTISLCLMALPLLVVAASAQEPPPGMPPLPKAGPEHAVLKQDEGVWDASVEMFMGPGAPPMVSKGVETNTLGQGGLFLITDFKGDMMGTPFHGHGVSSWDSTKKKYTGTWTDSMSTGISLVESTYDAAAKKMTGTMEGPDMTGKVNKMKETVEWKDADTRVFTMFAPTPDGKEVPAMRITYKRRK
jgi:hypothetical protein